MNRVELTEKINQIKDIVNKINDLNDKYYVEDLTEDEENKILSETEELSKSGANILVEITGNETNKDNFYKMLYFNVYRDKITDILDKYRV